MYRSFYGIVASLALVLVSSTIRAEISGGSAQDLLGITQPPKFKDETENKVKITTRCVDAQGISYSSKDTGYDRCLMSAQAEPPNPVKKGKGPNLGVGFQVGEGNLLKGNGNGETTSPLPKLND